jgi:phage tail-like protein
MPTSGRVDPFRTFNFHLEFNGQVIGGFSEVSGLTADGDAVDYREGSDPQLNVRKLVGMRKFGPVTCKRGYTLDKTLWDWHNNISNGVADRRDVTVILLNEAKQPVLRWHIENAWVNKIEGPSMKASANEVAIESVELIHEGLTIE